MTGVFDGMIYYQQSHLWLLSVISKRTENLSRVFFVVARMIKRFFKHKPTNL